MSSAISVPNITRWHPPGTKRSTVGYGAVAYFYRRGIALFDTVRTKLEAGKEVRGT